MLQEVSDEQLYEEIWVSTLGWFGNLKRRDSPYHVAVKYNETTCLIFFDARFRELTADVKEKAKEIYRESGYLKLGFWDSVLDARFNFGSRWLFDDTNFKWGRHDGIFEDATNLLFLYGLRNADFPSGYANDYTIPLLEYAAGIRG